MPLIKYCSFILLFCISYILRGQTPADLQLQLKKATTDTAKSKLQSDIGRAYFKLGDFSQAQQYFFEALKSAEKAGSKVLQESAANNISIAYFETENYNQATLFAQKAIRILETLNEPKDLANAYNSLANCYYMQMQDSLALHYFRLSLTQRLIAKDTEGLFAGYKNLGAIHFEMKDTATGISYIKRSLGLLTDKKDSVRWFTGYITLAEAYLYSGNLPEARTYLDSTALYVSKATTADKKEDYHYTLYQYFKKKNELNAALKHFELYSQYRDTVVNAKRNQQLEELNVKYETEKKEKQLQRQRYEIGKKNNWLIAGGAALLVLVVSGWFIYRNNQLRNRQKINQHIQRSKDLAAKALFEGEQNERIRIARDLHDSVGQMLALVQLKLSSFPAPQKDLADLGGLIATTTGEVRNISHNLLPQELNFGLMAALEALTDKINLAGTVKVTLDADKDIRDTVWGKDTQLSIYRIIQEILTNILRHAEASIIRLELRKAASGVIIDIHDNGKGMELSSLENSKGIGWKNIKARIDLLDGTWELDSAPLKGSRMRILLPLTFTI